jgi:hypothetical protein
VTPGRAALWTLFLLVAGACSDVEELTVPEELLFRDSRPSVARHETLGLPGFSDWEQLAELGSLDGEITFSIINGVALSGDTLLAVADRQTCSVFVIDLRSEAAQTLGRCGDGPGEFIDISQLAFGDGVLWVYDLERRKLSEFNLPTGGVSREIPIADFFSVAELASVSDIVVSGPDELTIGLRRRVPRTTVPTSLVATLDLTASSAEFHPIFDPPATEESSFAWAPSAQICGMGDGIVAANEWVNQVAHLGVDGEARFDVVLDRSDWWVPTMMRDSPPSPIPPLPGPRLACNSESAFISYQRRKRIDGKSTILHSRFIVADAAGRVLHDEEVEGPRDGTVHALTIGAAGPTVIAAYTSQFAAYPIVRILRIPPDLRGPRE